MICEGILNLCGTSSEEIIAKAKKESDDYYLSKIDELTATNEQLTSSNKELASSVRMLSSQIAHLQDLLRQNNISFE
ncbi:MAG: keratin [Lachnospiraceae bacterium]|nr:keratin [Lachnospiraceae bacterium]